MSTSEVELLARKGLGTTVRIRQEFQFTHLLALSLGNGMESRELERLLMNTQYLNRVPKNHVTKEKLMSPLTVDTVNVA